MSVIPDDIKRLLDCEAARINNPDFIADDPVQFPRRFESLHDIEITALLCATIAWGRRTMICANCNKMLALMDNDPYHYMMGGEYELLPPEMNIHRTFFVRNLQYMLRGLRRIFSQYGSLNDFAHHHHISGHEEPAWRLVEMMHREFREANGGKDDSRCLPTQLKNTALKRVNMALRWLVRDDGIVDLGVWNALRPSQLFIPLDVHVGDTARALGLVDRRANDRRTVTELTATLRAFNPEDPVIYDFALFGLGMNL